MKLKQFLLINRLIDIQNIIEVPSDIVNDEEIMEEYHSIRKNMDNIEIEPIEIDSRIDRNIPDWGMVPQIKKNIIQMLHTIEKNVSDNIFSYPHLYDVYDELRKIIRSIEENEEKDD